MLGFLKKTHTGQKIELQITGMHCTSCSLNIDTELEELPGIHSAETNYATALSVIWFDQAIVNVQQILDTIMQLGYTAKVNK